MRRFAIDNGLSLFFGGIFVVTIVAQAFAGHQAYNAEQVEHGSRAVSLWSYVWSAAFWGDVMENWQSEFLQFTLFIGATIWLVQKGSNESKPLEDAGRESNERQRVGRYARVDSPGWAKVGGVRRWVYENSLLTVMTALFLLTWLGQSLNNWRAFNADALEHGGQTVSWGRYLLDPDFWERTLQNWQSEFLAVGTMVVFTIYLRQRGSPESKPVGAPHDETGSSG